MSKEIRELVERGVCRVWPPGSEVPAKGRVKFGIDPTRDRLHLGHMVPLRVCRALQDAGWHLDLVMGTLTASLGDPSGQDKTRPILSMAEVQANAAKLTTLAFKVLSRAHVGVEHNHNFVNGMAVPQFLVNLVSRFTVASLMARKGFQDRGEAGVRAHELLVPLLQGWDSVTLQRDCSKPFTGLWRSRVVASQ